MIDDNRPESDLDKVANPSNSRRSYHGLLVVSSRNKVTGNRRSKMRSTILRFLGWIGKMTSPVAIFIAGLSLGAAIVMRRAAEREGVTTARPAMMAGVGVGCLMLAFLIGLFQREFSKWWTTQARNWDRRLAD